ncbi:carbohydrate-binding module family 1 protein [Botryobasidium botryosum FD-172 SS1]|uniref:Carbohydrate-binding module family 1 protein n=1 Tax=Botryobasidium botryosum (strain FD-172 SS1) TaxID=930990 RepID=A0A067M7X0_BOTB1|nr:carbohydrate-binding module family 1 protein [Botryobasidium botryosum FD-172 SS1]
MLGRFLVNLLPLVGAVFAQQVSKPYTDPANGITFQSYTDPTHAITFRWVFPPLTTPPSNEFIGEIVCPVELGYCGFSLVGAMTYSLIIMAWQNGNGVVLSPRWISKYGLPTVYNGPVITQLPSTSVNATHWKAVYRCQNCTSWDGGSLDLNGVTEMSWAMADSPPAQPSNSASSFFKHTDYGYWSQSIVAARDAKYSSYLGGSTTTVITTSSTSRTTTTTTSTSKTSTTSTSSTPSPTKTTSSTIPTTIATTTTTAPGPEQTPWGQCGGVYYSGPTACTSGWKCVYSNDYYSQCLLA